jgi:hypothetical protein
MSKPITTRVVLGELAFAAAWVTFPQMMGLILIEHGWTFWPAFAVQFAFMLFMVIGLNCLIDQAREEGRNQRG